MVLTSHAYNGDGQRISQTVSSTVTDYLLDIQPGLEVVLRETTGSDVESFVYDPRGMVHSQEKANGNWRWMAEDGLGSIRSIMDANASVVSSSNYAPYGSPFDVVGGGESPFGYTGEYTDATGDVFLRARYYNPSMGTFNALDPFEGYVDLPMSINGYSYVHGNPVNLTDPSGMIAQFLVGALGGLALGTIMGYAQGTMLYHLAATGQCDCDMQKQATQMGQSEFVRQSTIVGALMGTAIGFASTIPGGGLFLGLVNLYEKVEVARLLVSFVDDIRDNGQINNWCTVVELISEIFLEKVTNKLADGAPKRKRKINRNPDTDAPRQRRNGRSDLNQRRPRRTDPQGQRRQSCSFSADTMVATQDGDKLISDVEVGDLVMGYSEVAGAVSFMHVTATHNELHETTLDVTIDGEVVHTTDEHPFYVVERGWIKAKDLQVGDVIFNTMGKDGIVEAVEVVNEPQLMYNLSVQLVASYFVGDGQWLVHNIDIIVPSIPEAFQPGLALLQKYAPKEFKLFADNLIRVEGFRIPGTLSATPAIIKSDGTILITYGDGIEDIPGEVADTLYHEGLHKHQPAGISRMRAELQAWWRSYRFSSSSPDIWKTVSSKGAYKAFLENPSNYLESEAGVKAGTYESPLVGTLHEKGILYQKDGLFQCGLGKR